MTSADKYGIYVVAEANVESHGMGYGDKTLAKKPAVRQSTYGTQPAQRPAWL